LPGTIPFRRTTSTSPRRDHHIYRDRHSRHPHPERSCRKDGKPAAGAFILLIPTAELHDIRHPSNRQQSDLDGSWDITGLAPGQYYALAIDNGWDLDWLKPAVLSRYLSAAVSVEIPGTDSTVQTLTEPLSPSSRNSSSPKAAWRDCSSHSNSVLTQSCNDRRNHRHCRAHQFSQLGL